MNSFLIVSLLTFSGCDCDSILCVWKDALVTPKKVCAVQMLRRGCGWEIIPCKGKKFECDVYIPITKED